VSTTVVLFTRDLRVRDNPALHWACATAQRVVPLFVLDPRVPSSPDRDRFLAQSLADLRASLRQRGGDLVVRRGDPATEAVRLALQTHATAVVMAGDASGYAASRQRRLTDACAAQRLSLTVSGGTGIVAPGVLRPSGGGDHYRVFTPYWRAWRGLPHRAPLPAPARISLPGRVAAGRLPATGGGASRGALPGGESAARHRLSTYRHRALGYAVERDCLTADATSRLSAYLHFGCVSAVTVASTVDSEELLRQLCWRDFFLQVLAAFPAMPYKAYRPGAVEDWNYDSDALDRWRAGQTGVPVVDAGMRQLMAEGYLPNRARLITAGYLVKQLRLDWREGLSWYAHRLVDADVANNCGNWQWVAGTGNTSRPNRPFNAIRQARRFDPDGDYVRRWVPELAGIPGPAVHEPWRLPAVRRRGYPLPAEHD
jgi:deoxyribodipyrimidine photo-lyase